MKTATCCPHCKEKPHIETKMRVIDIEHEMVMRFFFVECPFCGVRGPYMETCEEAVDAWNAFADVIESGDVYQQKVMSCRDVLADASLGDDYGEVVALALYELGFDSGGEPL